MNSKSDIYNEKRIIRQRVLDIRGKIPIENRREKSAEIYRKLCADSNYLNAGIVFFFAGYDSEVQTDIMIDAALRQGKIVALPKVMNKTDINFYRINSIDELIEGYKGIPEPSGEEKNLSGKADLIVMPGVAFDEKRNRLGYGRGYYDRYIAALPFKVKTIAICFDEQIVDFLPHDENDIRPDMIITDKRIL